MTTINWGDTVFAFTIFLFFAIPAIIFAFGGGPKIYEDVFLFGGMFVGFNVFLLPHRVVLNEQIPYSKNWSVLGGIFAIIPILILNHGAGSSGEIFPSIFIVIFCVSGIMHWLVLFRQEHQSSRRILTSMAGCLMGMILLFLWFYFFDSFHFHLLLPFLIVIFYHVTTGVMVTRLMNRVSLSSL